MDVYHRCTVYRGALYTTALVIGNLSYKATLFKNNLFMNEFGLATSLSL